MTRPGADASTPRSKLEPLSADRYHIEFAASAELFQKLERVRELLSHAVTSGELPLLVERAVDALIERELEWRTGAGKPRKPRALQLGSRHVPVEVERRPWAKVRGCVPRARKRGRLRIQTRGGRSNLE